jgi:hypothetical protein
MIEIEKEIGTEIGTGIGTEIGIGIGAEVVVVVVDGMSDALLQGPFFFIYLFHHPPI